ncbi:MAG: DNA mismatch repair protein MutS, partial [Alphaproteobacteria bacterium]
MNLSPSNPVSDKDATTPMLAHYKAVKAAHPDALVFYRMGDFYELFYDDAIKAAEALGITLTKRGKQAGEDVPMCGVPVHSVDGYLARLIKAGFRVAVCEQMEDPAEAKKRGGKTLVRRDVVRIVTPGTITEENLLDARRHNYLAALAEAQSQLGFAWLDLSTGDFRLEAVERSGIAALLARLEPKEMLLPEKLLQATDLFETFRDWKSAL